MTLSRDDKIALSNVRMEKALEFLRDAKANFKEGRFRTSVNRAYYAALNAARSLLILEGVNPESHEGVVTMLSLRFVKPGLMDVQSVKTIRPLCQEEPMWTTGTLTHCLSQKQKIPLFLPKGLWKI
ncbi:MAG: HEPN domain-containing protein [Nitrospirae bacterium]|nr:MAG: HEPN domain-containing protein [Nitrospirota bacterium]